MIKCGACLENGRRGQKQIPQNKISCLVYPKFHYSLCILVLKYFLDCVFVFLLLTCEFSRVRAVPFHISVFSTWYTQQVLECFERMNEWEEREKSDMPMVVSVSGIDAGLCENKQTNKKQGTVQGLWDKIWPVFVKSEKFECCPSPEKGTILPWPFS